jgi:hypothetical protein
VYLSGNSKTPENLDQVHSIKNKWKTGDVEKAETREFSAKDEIEELRRGGTKVADRFHEGQQGDDHVQKAYDKSELDTAGGFFILV